MNNPPYTRFDNSSRSREQGENAMSGNDVEVPPPPPPPPPPPRAALAG